MNTLERVELIRRQAGLEYLSVTRHADAARYDEVEEWAWERLQEQLRIVQRVENVLREEGGGRAGHVPAR